jgi:hypothetical protein
MEISFTKKSSSGQGTHKGKKKVCFVLEKMYQRFKEFSKLSQSKQEKIATAKHLTI